jgi:hypothetical protein
MKFGLVLSLLLLFSCTRHSSSEGASTSGAAPPPAAAEATSASATAEGAPYALALQNGVLNFCDKRGARKLDLKTATESAATNTCPAAGEANTACSGLSLDVVVRSPQSEPNDAVEVQGNIIPMSGRVHDCTADGKLLAVATASSVVLVDSVTGKKSVISDTGADRVAIGSGWVAWSQETKLKAVKQQN